MSQEITTMAGDKSVVFDVFDSWPPKLNDKNVDLEPHSLFQQELEGHLNPLKM